MGSRGRKSSASLATNFNIDAHKRPPPPATLEEPAAEEWRKVVAMMPPTWFPIETHALLEDRCRHVVWTRFIANEINELIKNRHKTFDSRLYNNLLKSASYHSRLVAMLDTKMRLTQQSSYDRKKTKTAKAAKIPWSQGSTKGQAADDTNSWTEEH